MSTAPQPTFPVQFPNGIGAFTCSANSPESIASIFQKVVAQVFGFDLTAPIATANDSTNPGWKVRVGWQQQGQPAYTITDDVCIITAYTDDDPFGRVTDTLLSANDSASLTQETSYTQVWKIHFVCYGPNAFTNAVLIVAAMGLDWVHDALAVSNIYAVTDWKRPEVLYENEDGQWWQRADVKLRFNELVQMNLIVPAAAGIGVTLVKENGLSRTVAIEI
jgi:hypothetical protein